MRRSPAIAAAAAVLLLAGCSAPTPTSPSTSAVSASATPTPTPTPTVTPELLVIGIESISYQHGDGVETVSYSQPELMLDLLTAISDVEPTPTEVEDLPGYDFELTRYDFDGVVLTTSPTGPASIQVSVADLNDVRVSTTDGIAVGDSRASVAAAGGRDGWDEDADGVADWMELGALEVAGTQSLVRPGSTGIMFVTVGLDGDVVRELQAPGNDFSDI